MGIFFSDRKTGQSDDPQAVIRGTGGNPDDRPRPNVKPHTSGRVSKREFQTSLFRARLSARDRNIVTGMAAGFLDRDGGKTGMNYREVGEFMQDVADHGKQSGISTEEAGRLSDALDKAL